jgi:hypothetical protein
MARRFANQGDAIVKNPRIKAWNAKLKGRIQKAVKAAAKQQQQLNLNI